MLNIYTQIPDLATINRKYLVDILKPIFPEKRLAKYGLSNEYIKIVDMPNRADYFLLPFSWNYYISYDNLKEALDYINKAKSFGKNIIIFFTGDYYYSMPKHDNIIGLHTSIYKSKKNVKSIPLPVIIQDPLLKLEKEEISISKYNKRPSIGFCGQSDPNLIISSIKMAQLIWQNMKYSLNLSNYYLGPAIPPTLLRKKALDILDNSNKVHSNFIRRTRYQGGVSKEDKNFKMIRKEFYQNIEKNHYTLCVRGTGNFSARFYETLSLGRIPVLINTDCILPFANQINWREHIICIEQNELADIDYKILDFHTSLSQDSLAHIQKMNRKLWKNKFSFPGFVRQLTSNLKEAVNS